MSKTNLTKVPKTKIETKNNKPILIPVAKNEMAKIEGI